MLSSVAIERTWLAPAAFCVIVKALNLLGRHIGGMSIEFVYRLYGIYYRFIRYILCDFTRQ